MGVGKESLPPKYVDRIMTELKATVDPGENEINFDLEPGPVNPPQVKGKRQKSGEGTCY